MPDPTPPPDQPPHQGTRPEPASPASASASSGTSPPATTQSGPAQSGPAQSGASLCGQRPVTRRTARGIILTPGADGLDLLLIHRTRPGTAAYWTTPGGGMDPDDPTLTAALAREVMEETGATIGPAVPVYLHTTPHPTPDHPDGVKTAVFFVCRLRTIDDRLRHGPEVTTPRGTYRTDRVPYTPAALAAINLSPPPLAPYLTTNREALTALLPP